MHELSNLTAPAGARQSPAHLIWATTTASQNWEVLKTLAPLREQHLGTQSPIPSLLSWTSQVPYEGYNGWNPPPERLHNQPYMDAMSRVEEYQTLMNVASAWHACHAQWARRC